MSKYLRPAGLPGVQGPEVGWQMRRKGDVWEFVDEQISACGSELYPADPAVVKAIREFEPDFCPLWVTSVYRSPAGSYKVFGRHAIGIDCRSHVQEGSHRPLKVLTSCYGVNAGRRPILIESILQDENVEIIPDLKVFGYAPMDWGFYYRAKEGWYETRKAEADSDKAADSYMASHYEEKAKAKKAVDDEADYRFDHVSNRGQKIKEAFQSMTHADWRAMGVR